MANETRQGRAPGQDESSWAGLFLRVVGMVVAFLAICALVVWVISLVHDDESPAAAGEARCERAATEFFQLTAGTVVTASYASVRPNGDYLYSVVFEGSPASGVTCLAPRSGGVPQVAVKP